MEKYIKGKGPNKTVIISHEDLDGIGSAYVAMLLAKHLKPDNEIVILTSMQPTAIKTFDLYNTAEHCLSIDLIIVADRAIEYGLAYIMTLINSTTELYVFDHHISAKENLDKLKSLPRTHIFFDTNICATKILADYYLKLVGKDKHPSLEYSANLIDKWDTFKWKDDPESEDSIEAVKWNQVSGVLEPELVFEAFEDYDLNLGLMEGFELFHRLYKIKLDKAYDSINDSNSLTKTFDNDDESINVKFIKTSKLISAEKYSSIADRYLTEHTGIDIIVFIDDGLISVRGRDISPLSALEFTLGIEPSGGGHKNACGASLCKPWLFKDIMMKICINRFHKNTDWTDDDYEDIHAIVDEFIDEIKCTAQI